MPTTAPDGSPAVPPTDPPTELQPLTAQEERLRAGSLAGPRRGPARDEDYLGLDWSGASVRAGVVRWLAEGGIEIDLSGVEITGSLDLSDTTVKSRLRFRRCLFRERLDVSGANLVALDLSGSRVLALRARGLRCDTLNFADRGVAGRVDISSAQLGHVSFTGLLLDDPHADRDENDDEDERGNRSVLNARVLATTRSADFNRGFEARGKVRFTGASIGGQLNFRNAVVHQHLSLHEATISRALYLRDGLFMSQVNLAEARIAGRVDGTDATFTGGTARALNLNGTTVGRAVQLTRAVVEGTVAIRNSRIEGSLRLTQAVVRAPETDELAQGKRLTPQQAAAGATAVLAALPQHPRVRAEEITAEEYDRPKSRRADIRTPGSGIAVRIDNSTLGSALVLTAAALDGSLDVTATSVAGGVDVSWARLGRAEGDALRLSESTVGGTLTLRHLTAVHGRLDLSRLAVGRLDDDRDVWESATSYDIRGLTYQALSADEELWSAKARRDWLREQTPFSPQPYEQLAALLMRNGRRQEAWRVLEKERGARRRAGALRWWQWPTNVASGLLLGHGYRPEFALVALFVLAGLGWSLYDQAWDAGAVRPVSATETVEDGCTSTGACFEAWRHSFEHAFPFLGLGDRQAWRLDDRVDGGVYSHLARLQTVLGWVFATAGVAGLTRRAVKT